MGCRESKCLSSPRLLVCFSAWCPGDSDRSPARSFATNFSDSNLSYFIGVDVTNDMLQMVQAFLSGDRNLTRNGSRLGHGIHEFTTNQLMGWTGAFHKDRGNIALGDGSVEILSSKALNEQLGNTGFATNRLAIP